LHVCVHISRKIYRDLKKSTFFVSITTTRRRPRPLVPPKQAFFLRPGGQPPVSVSGNSRGNPRSRERWWGKTVPQNTDTRNGETIVGAQSSRIPVSLAVFLIIAKFRKIPALSCRDISSLGDRRTMPQGANLHKIETESVVAATDADHKATPEIKLPFKPLPHRQVSCFGLQNVL